MPWDSDNFVPRGICSLEYAGLIGAGVALIGVGVSAYGAYESQHQQAKALGRQQNIEENNAMLARQQADIDAETLAEKQRRFRATQRLAISSSGVEEEGSPLLDEADTASQHARDLFLVHYGGDIRSASFNADAALQGLYAKTKQQSAYIGAGASLLTGAGSVATTAYYARYGSYLYPRSPSSGASAANALDYS
jgi:hypothetical protein